MRHRYVCPVRWADLDLLGHVNNVRYVDYLQEARVDMLRAYRWSGISPGAQGEQVTDDLIDAMVVGRHEVTYRAPLHFREEPVLIDCWVTEVRAASFTMAYEVFHEDPGGERVVYLEASTVLVPYRFATESPRRLTPDERSALETYLEPAPRQRPERIRVDRDVAAHYPVQVRFSDVDVYRHVNNVVYVEYYQEARIRLTTELVRDLPEAALQVVVAHTDVDYIAPILLRAEPYDCWTAITRLGRTSVVLEAEIADGERTLSRARTVMVFVDPRTETPTEPPTGYRERASARFPAAGGTSG